MPPKDEKDHLFQEMLSHLSAEDREFITHIAAELKPQARKSDPIPPSTPRGRGR